jgi:hypothetical protein
MRALLLLLFAFVSHAHAQQDVGLVSLVAGEVAFQDGAAKAFMKVREGDRFSVPAGAQVRLVYFQASRQETHTGPADFIAGSQQSAIQSGAQPQVSTLPASVPQRISRVPELMQNARLGGIQVRGSPVTKRAPEGYIQEATAIYESLRKDMPATDITPELYLYSALSEYQLYEEMAPVVREMERKQPGNDDVRALSEWLKTRRGK